MRSLWRLIVALALVAALAPALAGAQNTSTNIDCAIGYHMSGSPPQCVRNTLTVASATQPQGGQALAGATVAMVAVALTNPGSSDTTITGITVQRVGSAPDAAVAKLQVNDSATSILANVPAQFNSTHSASIPLSATIAAGASKTLLVSVTMANDLTAYRGQSFEVNITGITTTATLSGPLPVYGAQATIATNIPPPTCSLGASQGTFQVGDTVNVEWSSTNATGGTITGIGSVAPSGLQGILPGGSSQTLVGTFTGPGGTGTCQLTLTLNAQGTGGTIFSGGVGTAGTVAPPGQNGSGGAVVGSGGTASTPTGGTVGSTQGQGLIPCTGLDCRPCDFAGLAQNVINTLIGLSIPLAAAMFAWAGILYFTSASNPKNIEKARSVFKVVFWGFLIAISAWLIIQILINAVVSKNFFTNGSWNSLSCSSQNTRPGTPGGGYTQNGIGGLLNLVTGGINNTAPNEVPLAVGQTSAFNGTFSNFTPQCDTANGFSYNSTSGQCINAVGEFTPPTYSVAPGSVGTVSNPELAAQIAAACSQYGMDSSQCALAQNISINESSGGKNCTTSTTGAVGCFQVLPTTACSIDSTIPGCGTCRSSLSAGCATVVQYIADPNINTGLGVQYIQQQLNTFGSCQGAAAAYYAGPGAVQKAGGVVANIPTPNYPGAISPLQYATRACQ